MPESTEPKAKRIKKHRRGHTVEYDCLHCGEALDNPLEKMAGAEDTCPICGASHTVPGAAKLAEMRQRAEKERQEQAEREQREKKQREIQQAQQQKQQLLETKRKKAKPRSVPLAIGLNLVLPGLGYLYGGRVISFFAALLFCLFIILPLAIARPILILIIPMVHLIMALDLIWWIGRRNEKAREQNTQKCPYCAELIKPEAKLCRYCGSTLDSAPVS